MDLPSGFYGVTDEGFGSIKSAKKLLDFNVKILQYRRKMGTDRVKYEEAKAIGELLNGTDVIYIINDRIDIAIAVQADGIHVGKKDMPLDVIYKMAPKNFIVGFSVHSKDEIPDSKICDYIGVGSIFSTDTKKDAGLPIGIEKAKEIVEISPFPVYLIGGIKLNNIGMVKDIRARGFISISDVLYYDYDHFKRMIEIWNN